MKKSFGLTFWQMRRGSQLFAILRTTSCGCHRKLHYDTLNVVMLMQSYKNTYVVFLCIYTHDMFIQCCNSWVASKILFKCWYVFFQSKHIAVRTKRSGKSDQRGPLPWMRFGSQLTSPLNLQSIWYIWQYLY